MFGLKRVNSLVFYLALILLYFSLTIPALSQTLEEVIPPCFTGSELEKVREWEKTWVGKKVGLAEVDQVKDLLPDPLVQIMNEPQKWGTKELWFEVVPYQYCTLSKGVLEATKKYSPLSKLDPKGFKTPWGKVEPDEFLVGYDRGELAGYPFPKPKTGLEMAWNYDSRTSGDNYQTGIYGLVVNCRTGAERRAHQPMRYMYWTGRTDMPPIPRVEPNPKKIRRTRLLSTLEPADVYGTSYLELIYSDPRMENDGYVWVAMFRRIRRSTTTQRGDTIDGSDSSVRDGEGYDDQINRNTYKFLEIREMLACRHQDESKLVKQKGQGLWSGQQRERCKLYLLEVLDKSPNRIYTKEIWYLDGETWMMPYKQCWDREGRMWRFLDSQVGYFTSIQGNPVPFPVAYNYVDVQRLHGSPTRRKAPKFGIELSIDDFTVQNLMRSGH